MMSLVSFLKDPMTVVKFQRLCGVVRTTDVPRATPRPESDASNGSKSSDQARQRCAKQSETVASALGRRSEEVDNGDHQHSSETENTDDDVGYVVGNRMLYYLFHFGAFLGNEVFYITFWPFWFWNIDGYVGRQLTMFWCLFMYVGQAMKDVVRIPRPASPPVIQLEKRYVVEYGMPSTHAMVGAGFPFAIFFLTSERYIYPWELALVGAIVWCSIVCFSRLYLGMHTALDVLAGLGLIFMLMAVCLPFLSRVDDFLLHSRFAPLVCVFVPLAMTMLYPTPGQWNVTRRDTTYILAAGTGVALGHWVSYQYGYMMRATTSPPYDIIPPTWTWTGLIFVRIAIGVGVLLSLRAVVMVVLYRIACLVAGIDHRDVEAARRHIGVDMSHKYITYVLLSFGMVLTPPTLFHALGIERETYFTEI